MSDGMLHISSIGDIQLEGLDGACPAKIIKFGI